MGLVDTLTKSARRSSTTSSEGATMAAGYSAERAPDGNPDDTEVLDKEEGNLVMALISQLRIGMDLTKITLPTFVLEPRSMLERITDFTAHPELIFGAGKIEDPKQRFLHVTSLILAGWHIKPKGVKKPYNPVLGEFFRCTYHYEDGSEGYYVAEQVSHHPPISAFFYVSPRNRVIITGELKPKSKFLGNSVATILEGEDRVRLLDRPEDGEYTITMPNMFARGILFGKMLLELGDFSSVRCPSTNYSCDIEFKTKGWISGGYNAVSGTVKGPGGTAGEIAGHWDQSMEYKDKGGRKQVLFDAATTKVVQKLCLPEAQQEPNESRRLWAGVTRAIKAADMEAATAEKSKIEEAQREKTRAREASGQRHQLRFFEPVGEKYMPNIGVDRQVSGAPLAKQSPDEMARTVKEWLFGEVSTSPSQSVASGTQATPLPPSASVSHFGSETATMASTASMQSLNSVAAVPVHVTAPGPPVDGPKLSIPPPHAH
ncbi:hypothetical protein QFC22_005202 [Naganishia vaughanmartiniae]|uniref:Uncharacterized protein n=1 Tax=Naganishia vaughanmartiniae TaxID=1424756 RepID=A0ACC2WWB7_9TREE|nr:hypothetical protein QFC22_005202 [Naganishia vaughanmartiniae]